MALRRTLAHRLLNISTKSTAFLTNCRTPSSSFAVQSSIPPSPAKLALDPADNGVFRRFLQWRPIYQSAATSPGIRSLPIGEKLLEKLRGVDIAGDRIRLEGLIPPPVKAPKSTEEGLLTAENARKLLRLSQLEIVKSKLRQISKDHISLSEFVQICSDGCSDAEQGMKFAKILDESGTVIILRNVVFLRPEQVVKVVQGLMLVPAAQPVDQRQKELEDMEKQKASIDKKVESLVRRELWCGLGYLVIQTAAFMRLTFWELSWDVMEPICFYVTSIYFMAGYTFFLRTSKEPSFEGFFQSRFGSKQKRLMKIRNFDVARYTELRRACSPHSSAPERAFSFTPSSGNSERTVSGALN